MNVKQGKIEKLKLQLSNLGSPVLETYEGDFRNGVYHGLGLYVWSDGRQYEGL